MVAPAGAGRSEEIPSKPWILVPSWSLVLDSEAKKLSDKNRRSKNHQTSHECHTEGVEVGGSVGRSEVAVAVRTRGLQAAF